MVTNVWLVAILLVIIATVSLFLFPPSNRVLLPPYLDRCVKSPAYHSHPSLQIIINGVNDSVPANLGYGSCLRPLHTHQSDGIIHVEPDLNRDYTIGDLLLSWANSVNDPTIAIFNSTQIFSYKSDSTHGITMSVNGQPNSGLQNFAFPRNAGSPGDTCPPSPSCIPYRVVIRYGSE